MKRKLATINHNPALVLLAIAASISLASCSPRIVEHLRTEYKAVTDHQRDTLWRDREKVVLVKGDTVRITEKEYIYKTLWKSRTDTLFVHDTTAIERVKEVKVEKSLSVAQRLKIGAFWWLVILCIIAFRREIYSFIKFFL